MLSKRPWKGVRGLCSRDGGSVSVFFGVLVLVLVGLKNTVSVNIGIFYMSGVPKDIYYYSLQKSFFFRSS